MKLARFEDYAARHMGCKALMGVTNAAQRREAIRDFIREKQLGDECIGSGKATWRQAFERFYGTQLESSETELAITDTEIR